MTMRYRKYFVLIACICVPTSKTDAYQCDRTPDNISRPRNRNDVTKYIIEVSGKPEKYVPGETYIVSLKLNPMNPSTSSFTDFVLTVEEVPLESSEIHPEAWHSGTFHLLDYTLTKFSKKCPNTVVQTNSLPKKIVNVTWLAPPKPPAGSRCVAIRATVVESKMNWFSDDGSLTKKLCEEESESEDVQPKILDRCYACDEAKYEIAFQGMWSRNTHPRFFPEDLFLTKFSDLIGASHKIHHSFWNAGNFSSEGLRILAENGTTKTLETELKEDSENIRTIIKARELSYPNITGTTYTVFRVDKKNHLVSVVSKVTPSPDWFVGVSNLELCQKDGSWVESRVLNLFPWDAGTNDGFNYTTSDKSSLYPHQIRQITSNSPNDPRSPFYDDDGEAVKPLAKLILTRQRLYEKACIHSDNYNEEEVNENCATSEWMEWSACTSSCTKFRQRSYLQSENTEECKEELVEEQMCCESDSDPCCERDKDFRCKLGPWSEWSSCSATCGKGTKTRDRQFINPRFEKLCNSNHETVLEENEECDGTDDSCPDGTEETPEISEDCPNTVWTEWSPCNVSCGTGKKVRYRTPVDDDNEDDSDNDKSCSDQKHMEMVECYMAPCDDQDDNTTEKPFREIMSSSHTLSFTPDVILEEPEGPVINCKVSKWSVWSSCNATQPCKKGYMFRERYIKVHAQNGGTPCPKKLLKKRKCLAHCPGSSKETVTEWTPQQTDEFRIDCEMSPWSAWSPCSTYCGATAVQQRTRTIIRKPSENGTPCLNRKEERRCPLPLACSDRMFQN